MSGMFFWDTVYIVSVLKILSVLVSVWVLRKSITSVSVWVSVTGISLPPSLWCMANANVRPMVTFPAAKRHCPLTTGTKLYCLVNRGAHIWTTCPAAIEREMSTHLCFFGGMTSLPYLHADLILTYKILFGHVDLDVNLFEFCSAVSTRGHQFKLFKHRTNHSTRSSFFCERIINVWNSLPSSVNFRSINTFKQSIGSVDFAVFLKCF